MPLLFFLLLDEATGICRYPYHKYIDIGAALKYSGTIFSPNYPAPYQMMHIACGDSWLLLVNE